MISIGACILGHYHLIEQIEQIEQIGQGGMTREYKPSFPILADPGLIQSDKERISSPLDARQPSTPSPQVRFRSCATCASIADPCPP